MSRRPTATGLGRNGCCIQMRPSVLLGLEWAVHSAVTVFLLSCIVMLTPPDILRYLAEPAFFLPLVGVRVGAPTLGLAILKTMIVPFALAISFVMLVLGTLPLFCFPEAQVVVFFFSLWISRSVGFAADWDLGMHVG